MPSRGLLPIVAILFLLFLSALPLASEDDATGDFAMTDDHIILPTSATVARTLPSNLVDEVSHGGCECVDASQLLNRSGEDALTACQPVCMGQRSFLILRMGAAFINGEGVDLRVYECGSALGGVDDSYAIYISEDGHQWSLVSDEATNLEGESFAEFDLSGFLEDYWYVKIEPVASPTGSLFDGPEILAVEALNPAIQLSF